MAAVYLYAAWIRNWVALHCTCLHRKKWWPASCSRLHMFHERIFENLIANNTRIVQLRIKCNTIIPHVILQMAGGYKFWSGRFLKFASKPTRAESLLIVRLYIHGISVRFGVAVLAFCKKGFLNFAEFWNSLPNPHGASCFVLYAYLWLRRINRVKNIVNTMNSFQPDGLYATSPVARGSFETMQFTRTLSDLCQTRQRRAIRWCSNALIQLIFYA